MKRAVILNTILLIFVLFSIASSSDPDSIQIHFLDVQEGDAILIQSKDKSVLIDSGNLLYGYSLLDYFKKYKITKLNYLILTHPDLDHISGVFFILPKFPVQKIYDNGQELIKDDIYRWYASLVRTRTNYRALKKGDKLKIEDINLEVLWPTDTRGSSYNENSLVIKLSYYNFRCLFTGDLNKNSEAKILSKKSDIKANILKVAHHGYADATSQEFLQEVSPEVAVISTSTKKAPSPITLEALKKQNVKIYRTDWDGNIVITVDKKGKYMVRTDR